MKKSLKVLVAFAILSNALCLDLGRFLGIRRDWSESVSHSTEPEIVEVVRWRQPVCVVPGPGVPLCLTDLKKHQDEYERNSAKGVEINQSHNSEIDANEQKTVDISNNENSSNLDQDKSLENQENDFTVQSTEVISPEIVDSFQVENVDRIELDSSEESNLDDTVSLNLRSNTPGIEKARGQRRGRYLVISSYGKTVEANNRKPPAIYVTKVLNSPVTATLVANNCFPDIGVPVCDNYQETITIYKEPAATSETKKESLKQVNESVPFEDKVEEINENVDFWNDPSNPHFDEGTTQNEPQRPTGLLAQVVQHVISKPGIINAIPPEVIEVIANDPGVIQAIANAGAPAAGDDLTTITEVEIRPQVVAFSESSQTVVASTTSKPGLISSLLDIQRPGILSNFWNPGFNIFNRSTTTSKPDTQNSVLASSQPSVGGGLLSQSIDQRPVVQAIQDLIHKPHTLNTNKPVELKPVLVVEPTKRPGIFENLWNPGGFGIFEKIVPTTTTNKPQVAEVDQKLATSEETGSARPDLVEIPEKPILTEILFKPENDISGRPALPSIFNKLTVGSEEHEASPTTAPGIFGGLFSNPTRPENIEENTDGTKTFQTIGHSIFGKPVNKPLIIERPGAKPLLIEKPIYMEEKPAEPAGLFNFLIPSSNKPLMAVDHEVIKEPVYVYQKPQPPSGLLSNVFGNGNNPSRTGFFQGWAIFGNREKKPVEIQEPLLDNESQKILDESERVQEPPAKINEPTEEAIIKTNENIEPTIVEGNPSKLTSLFETTEDYDKDEDISDELITFDVIRNEDISTYADDNLKQKSELIPEVSSSEEPTPILENLQGIHQVIGSPESSKESTIPTEDILKEITSEPSSESKGLSEILENAVTEVAEGTSIQKESIEVSENPVKTIDNEEDIQALVDAEMVKEIPEETHILENDVVEAGEAEAVQEIAEEAQKRIVSQLLDIVEEAENLEKESVLDNET